MAITPILAMIAAAVLVVAAAFHVYWALGSRRAPGATVPQVDGRPAFTPSRTATLAVAAALTAAALLELVAAGLLPTGLPGAPIRFLTYALGAVFVGRAVGDFRLVGFFKRNREGAFARLDTLVYSPLCLALGLITLWVASRA